MLTKRIIARLDVKPPNKLVKGIQMEGLRKLGDPAEFAQRYYRDGADEIIYMDVDASLDGRCGIEQLIKDTTKGVFIPVTVGGGLRTVQDVHRMLMAGADKVAINTGAIHNPQFITEAARRFGKQCIVVAIEYRDGECFTDCGRELTGKNPIQWAKEAESAGAGELLLTSIERDGTRKGFDCSIIEQVASLVNIPVIAHGGCKTAYDTEKAFNAGASGVAIATALHYNNITIKDIKDAIHGYPIRTA